ncbi:MAG: DUF4351 domain-containing protein [Magnetococcales bacterium]|nr:DUF4351 domain-containing protein [Magnetococcales bacterium]
MPIREAFSPRGSWKENKEDWSRGVRKDARRGIRKGIRKDVRKAKPALLLRLLQRRFGPLPEEITNRIQAADCDTLASWSDRVLEAKTLAEVFAI